MKYDIQTKNNSIGGRQGWAYVCNSGEIPVLKADLDRKQEYDDFKKYGNVRIVWNYRGREHYKVTTLEWNACDGEARWVLGSWGCCLSGSFGLSDALDMIEETQTPIVRAGQIVAIASYSSQKAYIQLYRVSDRVDINCQTVASFRPLTEEEMSEVKKNAVKWLNF